MTAPRPFDFSIEPGRIGAPVKASLAETNLPPPEKVVLDQETQVLLTIRRGGAPPADFAISVESSVSDLHTAVGEGDHFLKIFWHGKLLLESAPQSQQVRTHALAQPRRHSPISGARGAWGLKEVCSCLFIGDLVTSLARPCTHANIDVARPDRMQQRPAMRSARWRAWVCARGGSSLRYALTPPSPLSLQLHIN